MANQVIEPDTREAAIVGLVEAFDQEWQVEINQHSDHSLIVYDCDGGYVSTLNTQDPYNQIVALLAKKAKEHTIARAKHSVQRAIRESLGLE